MRRPPGVLGVAIIVVLVASCGKEPAQPVDGAEVDDRAALEVQLARARSLNDPRVHWPGREADRLPLGEVEGPLGQGDIGSFYYGRCEGGSEEGDGPNLLDRLSGEAEEYRGCAFPIQIQNWSICVRRPHPRWKLTGLRGARAIYRPTIHALEVYTGRTAVVVFGAGRTGSFEIAAALRPVTASRPPKRLPPPAPGSLRGELPCQKRHPPPLPYP